MDAKHFASLFESVTQMDEIVHGVREPSREFHIDPIGVTNIRKATWLSQAKFAMLIDVQVGTLRKREQGRREPTGPAKALLRNIWLRWPVTFGHINQARMSWNRLPFG